MPALSSPLVLPLSRGIEGVSRDKSPPPLSPSVALSPPLSLSPGKKIAKTFGTFEKTPYLCTVKIKETTPDATRLQILTNKNQ